MTETCTVGATFIVGAVGANVSVCLAFVAAERFFEVLVRFNDSACDVESFLNNVVSYVGV